MKSKYILSTIFLASIASADIPDIGTRGLDSNATMYIWENSLPKLKERKQEMK